MDYREYTYAGGRFPGGFIKREGRMSEREVLTSRQIDRPIRPMFAEGFKCETQVIAFVLSADSENDPDVCGINGASAALHVSDIPFLGPIGAVRVGLVNGQFVVNPTYNEMRESLLNIMVVGTAEGIVMIESGAKEVKEETVVDAIEFGHTEIKKICAGHQRTARQGREAKAQGRAAGVRRCVLQRAARQDRRRSSPTHSTPRNIPKRKATRWSRTSRRNWPPICRSRAATKKTKSRRRNSITTTRRCANASSASRSSIRSAVQMRRAFDEIREIWIEAGVLPRTHGSAIFTRGETQALVTTTLGTSDDMQRLEGFEGEAKKRFMLHYNFPPFSVGEVAFMRGAGRREIGHGALAERAVSAVLPTEEKWPYAMRVVSDILESNGSSSMATHLRGFALADGCGRSVEGSGGWRCDGIGEGRRGVCDPHRHRGRGRSLRRHGLQSCRNAGWHHGAADGYQSRGHHGADHARGAGAGTAWTDAHSRQDGGSDFERSARRFPISRRASTRCRFRSTRFAI